jgi:DNA polymerase zeta
MTFTVTFCCLQGRETLERAIKTIENTPEWGARVVYGDTDSVFVLLKGKTKVTVQFSSVCDVMENTSVVYPDPNP